MNGLTTEVHLALSGRVTFEQDIGVAQAAQVISMLQAPLGIDRPTPDPELPALPSPPAQAPEEAPLEIPARDENRLQRLAESPRQAMELAGARTIPEKMTAFAAYLLQEQEREAFTHSDVRRIFQRARERIPTHFSREFDKAVRVGWIHEGQVKDEYYLSDAALHVIEEGFDSLRAKRGRKQQDGAGPVTPRSTRRRSRSVTVPEAFADLDHIPSKIEGVIPYHRVKLKRDRLLWALKLAQDLGTPALQNSEATWLTDKLGDAIPSRDINGHFTGLHRRGFANRSVIDNAMRITEPGDEYLQSL